MYRISDDGSRGSLQTQNNHCENNIQNVPPNYLIRVATIISETDVSKFTYHCYDIRDLYKHVVVDGINTDPMTSGLLDSESKHKIIEKFINILPPLPFEPVETFLSEISLTKNESEIIDRFNECENRKKNESETSERMHIMCNQINRSIYITAIIGSGMEGIVYKAIVTRPVFGLPIKTPIAIKTIRQNVNQKGTFKHLFFEKFCKLSILNEMNISKQFLRFYGVYYCPLFGNQEIADEIEKEFAKNSEKLYGHLDSYVRYDRMVLDVKDIASGKRINTNYPQFTKYFNDFKEYYNFGDLTSAAGMHLVRTPFMINNYIDNKMDSIVYWTDSMCFAFFYAMIVAKIFFDIYMGDINDGNVLAESLGMEPLVFCIGDELYVFYPPNNFNLVFIDYSMYRIDKNSTYGIITEKGFNLNDIMKKKVRLFTNEFDDLQIPIKDKNSAGYKALEHFYNQKKIENWKDLPSLAESLDALLLIFKKYKVKQKLETILKEYPNAIVQYLSCGGGYV